MPWRKGKKIREEKGYDERFLGSTEHFQWYAEVNVDSIIGSDWIRGRALPYLERAYVVFRDKVLQVGELTRLPVRVTVRPSLQCAGGISGATGNGELSYCAGEWTQNQYCYGILTHELCNLFTGECITSGWPIAWWANHRSPFPTFAANEVMRHLVPEFYRMWGDYRDPLVLMFERLHKDFPNIFPRMFQKMREMRISLAGLEDPYLSQVVYYFMFWAAQKRLERYFITPMPSTDTLTLQRLENSFRLGVLLLPQA